MIPGLATFPRDPSLLVRDIDLKTRRVTCVPMTPRDYANASFHDESVTSAAGGDIVIDLDWLLGCVDDEPEPVDRPLHIVFHTAYCGSTLLARCLDAVGCFTLREPALLLLYARELASGNVEAPALGRLARVLLTRTWNPDHVVVAKPSNSCNIALGPILNLTPRGRGLFLYNSPHAAVLACIRRPEWTRLHARTIIQRAEAAYGKLPAGLAKVDVDALTDAQTAAYLWLVNVSLYLDLASGPLGSRVRSLESDLFLEHPLDALRGVCEHLGIGLPVERAREVIDGDLFRRHAKKASKDFSADRRAEELERVYRERRDEVDRALMWLQEITRERPVPDPLPRPLLGAPTPRAASFPIGLESHPENGHTTQPILTAYRLKDAPAMPLVPASASRDWMAHTRHQFVRRCLPLVIANQAGWFILNSHDLTVIWDGRTTIESLTLDYHGASEPYPASSHFGYGILTWHLPYLFRTSPGYNVLARGPANWPKAGIYPLEGLVETDWSVATFTMNWKLITPGRPVKFAAGEPVCMVVPQRRGELEAVQPVLKDIRDEPELHRRFREWHDSRLQFNEDLKVPGSDARKAGWQRHYYRGEALDGARAPEHQTRLMLKPFAEPE